MGWNEDGDEIRRLNGEVERLNEWHEVALILGESLASVGIDGYYKMQPREWLAWALKVTGATDQPKAS